MGFAVKRWQWILVGLILTSILTGCGTLGGITQEKPTPVIEPSSTNTPTSPIAKPTSKSTETPRKGGYYLDDGPGDNPPADIDAIPDAVPRVEAILSRTSRPYQALGETYTPMTRYQPYKATGIASWYGRRYHGQKTSSGEVYDMYGMTAAHTVLPIPSYARVTNPENGKTVVVKVNDRGPFKNDRLIDLSYAAAYKLRLTGKGSGKVEVEAIDPTAKQDVIPKQDEAATPPLTTPTVGEVAIPSSASIYLQVGAFRQKDNAEQLRNRIVQSPDIVNLQAESWYNDNLYRVRIGPFASREEALRTAEKIKESLGLTAILSIKN